MTSTLAIENVRLAAQYLRELNAPEDCLAGDKQSRTNHWTGTCEELRGFLGRRLVPEEITALSLSRCYGPTPTLNVEEAYRLRAILWPSGNSQGLRYTWRELAEALAEA